MWLKWYLYWQSFLAEPLAIRWCHYTNPTCLGHLGQSNAHRMVYCICHAGQGETTSLGETGDAIASRFSSKLSQCKRVFRAGSVTIASDVTEGGGGITSLRKSFNWTNWKNAPTKIKTLVAKNSVTSYELRKLILSLGASILGRERNASSRYRNEILILIVRLSYVVLWQCLEFFFFAMRALCF